MEGSLPNHEAWNASRAAEIIARHTDREGATLPILHALQAAFGCVPADAVPMVAEALNLSRAEVHGIVTFYHEFRREPPGHRRTGRGRTPAPASRPRPRWCRASPRPAAPAHARRAHRRRPTGMLRR
ncbi:MAG: NAD(P)H-dependent oxidoreductase subunit E, partial [Rhodospirillales bacterium]|nr:NAD(P)H-dependent oxidoreductase subunit E [Rhodospirillales bacterium]